MNSLVIPLAELAGSKANPHKVRCSCCRQTFRDASTFIVKHAPFCTGINSCAK